MAQQDIIIGTANAKAGDTLFSAFTKTQANFTEIFNALLTSTVTVNNISDFPEPVANVITLENGTLYLVSALINLGINTIDYGTNAEIRGLNSAISSLSSTSSSPLIKSNNQTLRLSNITIANPNGNLFDFTGSISSALLLDQVGAFSFLNIGTFHNTGIGVLNECFFANFAGGMVFTGTGTGSWTLSKSIFSGFSGIAIDLGTAVSATAGLDSNVFNGLVGSTSLSGMTNSGNITVRASIDKNVFEGGGTALAGIDVNDIKYTFTNNTGVSDSRNAADMFLTGGSETITTGSAGDWQELGTPSGGASWASDIADRFTVGADGVLTYIGEKDIEATLTGRATVQKSGGGADVVEVRFAINWTGSASDSGLEKSRAQTQNPDPTTVSIGALTTISTGDNVRVIFSNITGASNIIASVASVEVIG